MKPCPCGSGKNFAACCGGVIAARSAPTAEALMRSRYSAFVLGDLDYLAETAAGPAALKFDRADLEKTSGDTQWLGLDILEVTGGLAADLVGTVTFAARFRQNGQTHVLTEQSEFRRIDSAWRYWDGRTKVTMAAALKTGRNDPCPCGSGKKFKKCCGA